MTFNLLICSLLILLGVMSDVTFVHFPVELLFFNLLSFDSLFNAF